MQNEYYHALYEKLRPYIFAKNKTLAENPANKSLLEGWAKEDARYAISMATQTQLGMTINARNLELMLRRLAALPLAEAKNTVKNCTRQQKTSPLLLSVIFRQQITINSPDKICVDKLPFSYKNISSIKVLKNCLPCN